MIKASCEQLIERISKLSGLTVEEIRRRVEAKREKLSGLISLEGAAQIVAAELGISFEKQRFKIADLLIGMKKVEVIGKVIEVHPIKRYVRGGHEGEIATLTVADDSSSIRVVLWDTNHIDMIKNKVIKLGDVLEIKGADVRGTTARELHLSSNSSIEPSEYKIENIVTTEALPIKKLCELKVGERAAIRAHVVQAFQPNFFSVCPECSMKLNYENEKALCARHGTIIPKNRALMSFILDDGTNSIRALAFNESILRLLKIQEDELEKLQDSVFWLNKKQDLLGTEFELQGRVRKNAAFDRDEFIVEFATELEPEKLIKELS